MCLLWRHRLRGRDSCPGVDLGGPCTPRPPARACDSEDRPRRGDLLGPRSHQRDGDDVRPDRVARARRASGPARWLGIVTLVALLEQLIETVTLFGNRGFIAPGGPMNLFL